MMRSSAKVLWAAAIAVALAGCKSASDEAASKKATAAPVGTRVEVNCAGATSINPLMAKWTADYLKVAPGVQIYYQSVGSGAGVGQFLAHTVQFGTTDAPMTDAQLKDAKVPVVHVPLVMGGVVPVYNLPGLAHSFRFTPETLSGIFLGEIKNWNDPKLAADNPYLDLPDKPITVVHRSDGSGATFLLTDYLARISPAWKSKVGTANSVTWPVGQGEKGNDGVAKGVQATEGTIGYVELTYALQNRMLIGELRNAAGNFIVASLDSVAAADFGDVADDLRYSITNGPGTNAWPIAGTTWAVVYQDSPSTPEGAAAVAFLRWVVHEGQHDAVALNYAPLPRQLIGRIDGRLSLIKPK